MGPIKSRPFTFVRLSFVGVGFLAGTILVKPFLPETYGSKFSTDANASICDSNGNQYKAVSNIGDQQLLGIAKLSWPFFISGAWCIASSLGFLILSKYLFVVFFKAI